MKSLSLSLMRCRRQTSDDGVQPWHTHSVLLSCLLENWGAITHSKNNRGMIASEGVLDFQRL